VIPDIKLVYTAYVAILNLKARWRVEKILPIMSSQIRLKVDLVVRVRDFDDDIIILSEFKSLPSINRPDTLQEWRVRTRVRTVH
jgi:hypothetical protein